jgi:hypothetical protein
MLNFLSSLLRLIPSWLDWRRSVKVRVHHASLLPLPGVPAYFVNVLNDSPRREITVTHVWFETKPPVHVLTKPLPKAIAPGREWETWARDDELPNDTPNTETLARVRVGGWKVIESELRTDVPDAGYVPDG